MNYFASIETAFIGATAVAVAITSAALLMPASARVTVTEQAAPMHVVVVSAKRMTAEEKLQSLVEEHELAAGRQLARG